MEESRDKPAVSVIMAAFNAEAFIAEAVDSILLQTFADFELLIVDDASTDGTPAILASYTDPRLKVIRNAQNLGNHNSRNIALQKAEGEFVAIMDADDVAVPERLEWQLKFFSQHTDVAVLGGWMRTFGKGKEQEDRYPTDPGYIQARLLLKNAAAQPTVMMRSESLKKHHLRYDPSRKYMEDFDLWYRAGLHGLKIANIPEVLVRYRMSDSQESSRHLDERIRNLTTFLEEKLRERLGIVLQPEELELLSAFIRNRIKVDENTFSLLYSILHNIVLANKHRNIYEVSFFHANMYFFFLRLGKYHYLEYKKKPLRMYAYMAGVIKFLGFRSLLLFLRHEKTLPSNRNRKNRCPWCRWG